MGIPLNIDWRQILLHLMNFAILAGGLYILLYNPVKSFMQKRVDYYKGLDDAAAKKLKNAEETKANYDKLLDDAGAEIAEMRNNMFNEARQNAEQQIEAAKNEGLKLIAKAKKAAEEEKAKILASAQKEVLHIAATAADKLVLKSSSEALDQFLDSVKED